MQFNIISKPKVEQVVFPMHRYSRSHSMFCHCVLLLMENIGEDYPHLITGGAMVDQVQHMLSG
jgi:hypothetical protein